MVDVSKEEQSIVSLWGMTQFVLCLITTGETRVSDVISDRFILRKLNKKTMKDNLEMLSYEVCFQHLFCQPSVEILRI